MDEQLILRGEIMMILMSIFGNAASFWIFIGFLLTMIS